MPTVLSLMHICTFKEQKGTFSLDSLHTFLTPFSPAGSGLPLKRCVESLGLPISVQTRVGTHVQRKFAAGILDYPCLQGYLVGPPGKEIAVRLQVECVCVVRWEGAVHCVLLHRNTDYVRRTQMLASSLQNSCRNVKVVQKLDRQCLVKVLSREMAGVCSHRTSSCHSSPEY